MKAENKKVRAQQAVGVLCHTPTPHGRHLSEFPAGKAPFYSWIEETGAEGEDIMTKLLFCSSGNKSWPC